MFNSTHSGNKALVCHHLIGDAGQRERVFSENPSYVCIFLFLQLGGGARGAQINHLPDVAQGTNARGSIAIKKNH